MVIIKYIVYLGYILAIFYTILFIIKWNKFKGNINKHNKVIYLLLIGAPLFLLLGPSLISAIINYDGIDLKLINLLFVPCYIISFILLIASVSGMLSVK
jgi:hypothetical protein